MEDRLADGGQGPWVCFFHGTTPILSRRGLSILTRLAYTKFTFAHSVLDSAYCRSEGMTAGRILPDAGRVRLCHEEFPQCPSIVERFFARPP